MTFLHFTPFNLAVVGPFHSGRRTIAHHLVADSICTRDLCNTHHPLIVTTLCKQHLTPEYYQVLKSCNVTIVEVHRQWWVHKSRPIGPADALVANVGGLKELYGKIDRLVPGEVKANCQTQSDVKALWESSFGG